MKKLTKKVLIVDDDADIRESISLAVQEQDYVDIEVTECADVASGIAQWKKIRPDITILDLHLPDKSGFDFMDIMRSTKQLADSKVIMLTGDDSFKNIFTAEDKGIGVYHFLSKPFNVSELQALVLGMLLPIKV